MKKIGITGQNGFAGSYLFNKISLLKDEFELVSFDKSFFTDNDALIEHELAQGPAEVGVLADGLGDDVAHSSIRFGLGRFNTEAEVDYVADKVIDVVQKLRELSPLYEMVKEGIDISKIEWQAH